MFLHSNLIAFKQDLASKTTPRTLEMFMMELQVNVASSQSGSFYYLLVSIWFTSQLNPLLCFPKKMGVS